MSTIRTLQTMIEDYCPSFGSEIVLECLSDTCFLSKSEKGGIICVADIFLIYPQMN